MKILFMDDDTIRHQLVASQLGDRMVSSLDALDAIGLLATQRFDVVMLDHDLDMTQKGYGEKEMTGVDVASHIAAMEHKPPVVVVHSLNPAGADRMCAILRPVVPQVIRAPFGSAQFKQVITACKA